MTLAGVFGMKYLFFNFFIFEHNFCGVLCESLGASSLFADSF